MVTPLHHGVLWRNRENLGDAIQYDQRYWFERCQCPREVHKCRDKDHEV